MPSYQWKLAIYITLILLLTQFAFSKNWISFSPGTTLFADAEWFPQPSLPIATKDLVPVTADMDQDQTFVYTSYQPYEQGLLVRVDAHQPVLAKSSGMVLFTGEKRKTGKTMTIAYDSGDTVTYGFLHEFEMLPYTRFDAQAILGQSSEDLFYIHHDNHLQTLDPESLMMWLTME
ncbi:hypothetical protein MKY84_07580 [Chryseomicrobium sp. FSL W7-1435]|uniref:hypothetical protein n=1 Tax=Chryseomicrobium sp. FSL W7-1435 TaxID=2921704 RepID=UPI00315ACF24